MRKTSLLLASMMAVFAVDGPVAVADPIDNDGDADFVFYDNPGSPFLLFASGDEAFSETPSAGASWFEAFTEPDGDTFWTASHMERHNTPLSFGPDSVQVRLNITDVVGVTDLSSGVDIDWTITADLRFSNSFAGIVEATCRTASFDITIAGDWDEVESDPFTIPALSGSGAGGCNTHASTLNSYFDLGTSGATLTLYKFEAFVHGTSTPLSGS